MKRFLVFVIVVIFLSGCAAMDNCKGKLSMPKQNIEVSCSGCGSKEFEQPTNPNPDDMITCKGCGRSDKYGVLEQIALLQIEALIKKDLGDIF